MIDEIPTVYELFEADARSVGELFPYIRQYLGESAAIAWDEAGVELPDSPDIWTNSRGTFNMFRIGRSWPYNKIVGLIVEGRYVAAYLEPLKIWMKRLIPDPSNPEMESPNESMDAFELRCLSIVRGNNVSNK